MSDKLQLAIQATRAGDKKNAQFLLTQAIQEDPDNPQSWFLLSLLVDDNEKKQTYLNKVVTLDPEHEKAQAQLAALTETAVFDATDDETVLFTEEAPAVLPTALFSDSTDLVAQDAGETLPDWMVDDLPLTLESDAEPGAEITAVISTPDKMVPDWLQAPVETDWDEDSTPHTQISEITSPTSVKTAQDSPQKTQAVQKTGPKEKKPAKPQKGISEKQLNYLLIGLVITAVLVFLILAYFVFLSL
jgi:hypothetical protein